MIKDQFHLKEGENFDKICGQILFTTKGRLVYYCILCGQYWGHKAFKTHLFNECHKKLDDELKAQIKSRMHDLKVSRNIEPFNQTLSPPEAPCRKNPDQVLVLSNEILVYPTTHTVEPTKCDDLLELSLNKNQPNTEKSNSVEKIPIDKSFIYATEEGEGQDSSKHIKQTLETTIVEGKSSITNTATTTETQQALLMISNKTKSIEIEYSDENCDDWDTKNNECLVDEMQIDCNEKNKNNELIYDENQINNLLKQYEEQTNRESQLYSRQLEQPEDLIDEKTQDSYQSEQNESQIDVEITNNEQEDQNEEHSKVLDDSTVTIKKRKPHSKPQKKDKRLKPMKILDGIPIVRNVRTITKYFQSHIAEEERKFKCPVCELAFKDSHNMNLHLRRHTDTKSFGCHVCKKMFYTSTEAKSHSRIHEKRELSFLCTECGLGFATKSKLKNHQKRHTNQRDYVCEVCQKKFFDSAYLKKHMAVHSTEKPFSCEICKDKFKRPNALRSHLKQHENKRDYKCRFCEAAFNVQAGLYSHMKHNHKEKE